jgi:hypothetical protein
MYTQSICRIADYFLLELNLEGAPDETGAAHSFLGIKEVETEYPPRFNHQPHWLRVEPKVTDFWAFKLYHWIKNCYLEGTSIHSNSSHRFSITETKALEIESYKVLQAFRKPVVTPN